MHTGSSLGAALKAAIELKGVTQLQVADAFGVQQPSVAEWIKYGRIHKKHIPKLVDYFSDKVGPEHWGLPPQWRSHSPEAMELAEKFDATLKSADERKRGRAVCIKALGELRQALADEAKAGAKRKPIREPAPAR